MARPFHRCPEDAGRIPRVGEASSDIGTIQFYWCGYCGLLYAFVDDPPRHIASLFREKRGCLAGLFRDRRGWQVFRAEGDEVAVRAAVGAAVGIDTMNR